MMCWPEAASTPTPCRPRLPAREIRRESTRLAFNTPGPHSSPPGPARHQPLSPPRLHKLAHTSPPSRHCRHSSWRFGPRGQTLAVTAFCEKYAPPPVPRAERSAVAAASGAQCERRRARARGPAAMGAVGVASHGRLLGSEHAHKLVIPLGGGGRPAGREDPLSGDGSGDGRGRFCGRLAGALLAGSPPRSPGILPEDPAHSRVPPRARQSTNRHQHARPRGPPLTVSCRRRRGRSPPSSRPSHPGQASRRWRSARGAARRR